MEKLKGYRLTGMRTPKSRDPYLRWKAHGMMKSWIDNGQICSEFVMVDGWLRSLYGMAKKWSKWFETIRQNGVLVSDKVWNKKGELL